MYQDLSSSTSMNAFGLDLSESASDALSQGIGHALPYLVLIAIVAVTGFVQQRQIQGRNPNASVNPQQQMIMKIMPFFLPLISFGLPAGLVLYFAVSNLYRIGQQAFISRSIYGIHRGEQGTGVWLLQLLGFGPTSGGSGSKSSGSKSKPAPSKAKRSRPSKEVVTSTSKAKSKGGQGQSSPKRQGGQRQQPQRGQQSRKDRSTSSKSSSSSDTDTPKGGGSGSSTPSGSGSGSGGNGGSGSSSGGGGGSTMQPRARRKKR
jgi:YidC/Oxa1 family membrane protein insertase